MNEDNYQVFRYWNNGWIFKFRGELFGLPFYTQEIGRRK